MHKLVLLATGVLFLACASPPAGPSPAPSTAAAPAAAGAAAVASETPSRRVEASAPRPLVRVPMAYSVLGGDPLPIWIAKEQGLFERYGIDPDLTYIGGSTRIVEAIIAGEIRLAQVGGAAVVNASLGGADVVLIGSLVPVFVASLFSQPEITSVQELRGKSIAVTAIGTTTDFAGRTVLKRAGLEPLRDVAVIQSGGVPETFSALLSGGVQAGVMVPPVTLQARAAGLRELVDLAAEGIRFEQAPLATTRRFVQEAPDVVRGYLRAVVEGIALAKRDRPLAKRVLSQYTKNEDEAVLEETYRLFVEDAFQRVPYVTTEGLQTVLDLIDNPLARQARPEQFIDHRFLQELEASGFVQRLYE